MVSKARTLYTFTFPLVRRRVHRHDACSGRAYGATMRGAGVAARAALPLTPCPPNDQADRHGHMLITGCVQSWAGVGCGSSGCRRRRHGAGRGVIGVPRVLHALECERVNEVLALLAHSEETKNPASFSLCFLRLEALRRSRVLAVAC